MPTMNRDARILTLTVAATACIAVVAIVGGHLFGPAGAILGAFAFIAGAVIAPRHPTIHNWVMAGTGRHRGD